MMNTTSFSCFGNVIMGILFHDNSHCMIGCEDFQFLQKKWKCCPWSFEGFNYFSKLGMNFNGYADVAEIFFLLINSPQYQNYQCLFKCDMTFLNLNADYCLPHEYILKTCSREDEQDLSMEDLVQGRFGGASVGSFPQRLWIQNLVVLPNNTRNAKIHRVSEEDFVIDIRALDGVISYKLNCVVGTEIKYNSTAGHFYGVFREEIGWVKYDDSDRSLIQVQSLISSVHAAHVIFEQVSQVQEPEAKRVKLDPNTPSLELLDDEAQ